MGQKSRLRVVLFILIAIMTPAAPGAQEGDSPQDAVARIGDEAISNLELDQEAEEVLATFRRDVANQEYAIKRQILNRLIDSRLLIREAEARGLSIEKLVEVEVDSKVPPVTEEEIEAAFGGEGVDEETGDIIRQSLLSRRTRNQRTAMLEDLRARNEVRILLEPPRVAVQVDAAPARGPASAPVTLVEFSDFQCPYCKRLGPTLKQLEERYEGKVRFVFRNFPLGNHADAAKAAEAGACAHDQGRFWDMRNALFEQQQSLKPADLRRIATDLELDMDAFNDCLDSEKHASLIQRDIEQGGRYGVRSTPTLFINGRLLKGAQPLNELVAVVEEELERAAVRSQATASLR
jgi:protein-disulfide isomerase